MWDLWVSEHRVGVRQAIVNVPVYPVQEFLRIMLPFSADNIVTSIFVVLGRPAAVGERFGAKEPRDIRLPEDSVFQVPTDLFNDVADYLDKLTAPMKHAATVKGPAFDGSKDKHHPDAYILCRNTKTESRTAKTPIDPEALACGWSIPGASWADVPAVFEYSK